MASEGLTTVPSSFQATETMERLEAEIKARGMTVFARIDHAAGASSAGLSLRPTELLIFGVWEDASAQVWLTYNDPAWLAQRHDVGHGATPTISAMAASLGDIAQKTTLPP